MTTHLDADTVLALLDGQLSRQRALEVEAHIDRCAACRRVVSETAATVSHDDHDPPANGATLFDAHSGHHTEPRGPDPRGSSLVAKLAQRPDRAVKSAQVSLPVAATEVESKRITEPDGVPVIVVARRSPRRWPWFVAGVVLATAIAAVVAYALWPSPPASQARSPTLTRLVRRQGQVLSARPGPAGLYASVAFGDGVGVDGMDAVRIVRVEPDGEHDPVPGTRGMIIVAASSRALAVLREAKMQAYVITGKLALVDGTGNALPLVGDTSDIVAADFMPDGALAVVRVRDNVYRIEAPLGTPVYQSRGQIWGMRISPRGTFAIVEATLNDVRFDATVKTFEIGGKPDLLLGPWREPTSIAWSGERLVVAAGRDPSTYALWLVDGDQRRVAWTGARPLLLQDIALDGTVTYVELVGTHHTFVGGPGTRDRDISLSQRTSLVDLSADGKWVSVLDQSRGNAELPEIYVRSVDRNSASPSGDAARVGKAEAFDTAGEATLIGQGIGGLLSRDGRLVVSRTPATPWRLIVTTLAPSERDPSVLTRSARMLEPGDMSYFYSVGWIGDDTLVVLAEGKQGPSVYVQPIENIPRRRGGWPNAERALFRVSPDGKYIGDIDRDGNPAIVELATLGITSIPNHAGEVIVGWSAASDAVFVADLRRWPVIVTRHPLNGGAEQRQLAIGAPNPNTLPCEQVRVANDGTTYAYSAANAAFELYRLDGAL